MKTCEEYVINELIDANKNLSEMNEKLLRANREIDYLQHVYDVMRSILRIRKADTSNQFIIDMEAIWSEYDRGKYAMVKELFRFEEPREE